MWPINTRNYFAFFFFLPFLLLSTARVECIGTWGRRPPGLFLTSAGVTRKVTTTVRLHTTTMNQWYQGAQRRTGHVSFRVDVIPQHFFLLLLLLLTRKITTNGNGVSSNYIFFSCSLHAMIGEFLSFYNFLMWDWHVNPGNFSPFFFNFSLIIFFLREKQGNETRLVEWEGMDLRRRFRNPFRLRQKRKEIAMIFFCLKRKRSASHFPPPPKKGTQEGEIITGCGVLKKKDVSKKEKKKRREFPSFGWHSTRNKKTRKISSSMRVEKTMSRYSIPVPLLYIRHTIQVFKGDFIVSSVDDNNIFCPMANAFRGCNHLTR